MQHKRDWSEPVRVCSRHATFRVYLVHPDVLSMSKTFRMYLLHVDNIHNEHVRRLIHKQPMCMALTLIQIQIQSFCP